MDGDNSQRAGSPLRAHLPTPAFSATPPCNPWRQQPYPFQHITLDAPCLPLLSLAMTDFTSKMHGTTDLLDLAQRLLSAGPVRTLPTPRRIRILFNGTYIADTTRALFVWEHEYFPFYYVPLSSLHPGCWTQLSRLDSGGASVLRVSVGGRSTERVLAFGTELDDADEKNKGQRALAGMVRVEFGAADAWFEEDSEVFVHPKDPFKRVDTVHSSRAVGVFVNGERVAAATSAVHLFETGLPTRYYLPATAVDPGLLRASETVTRCPYKGEARYYDLVVKGKTYKDVVWYYRTPTLESSLIAGRVCFYNEKVDIELDGEKLERPVTKFA